MSIKEACHSFKEAHDDFDKVYDDFEETYDDFLETYHVELETHPFFDYPKNTDEGHEKAELSLLAERLDNQNKYSISERIAVTLSRFEKVKLHLEQNQFIDLNNDHCFCREDQGLVPGQDRLYEVCNNVSCPYGEFYKDCLGSDCRSYADDVWYCAEYRTRPGMLLEHEAASKRMVE